MESPSQITIKKDMSMSPPALYSIFTNPESISHKASVVTECESTYNYSSGVEITA